MFGANIVVLETLGLFLGQVEGFAGTFGKFIKASSLGRKLWRRKRRSCGGTGGSSGGDNLEGL
jgi:hypothetical protein